MLINDGAFRRQAAKLTAILLVLVVYGFARIPEASESELAKLAEGFRFRAAPLPTLNGETQKMIRDVNPSLRRVAGWISSVGAAVALNDLDGDGLPNDACYVDTRIDKVIVTPVPGTPARYQSFTLDPINLPYNTATMAPMGCLPGDFNEDGFQDVLAYYWGRTPVVFIKQNRTQSTLDANSYTQSEVVPGGARWYTNAATLADIDGDGHTDIIIGNFFPDGARILDARATIADEMQDSMSLAQNGGKKHLLLWKPPAAGSAVQFEEVNNVLDERSAQGWALAIGAADLDGDLLPEIYFANDFGPDRLLHNRSTPGHPRFALLEGRRSLTTTKSKVLGRDSYKGMGVDFGDLNSDGWPDIYVSNITQEYGLEESHFVFLSTGHVDLMKKGVAPYIDRGESLGLSRSGWGWETRLGDFNNDGSPEALHATGFMKGTVNRWPELHEVVMGNDQLLRNPRSWPILQAGDDISGNGHNYFFVRASDGRFHDVAAQLSLNQPLLTRGIATADVDGDGRLDYAVANQWGTSYFYRNESNNPGAFVGIRMRLPIADGVSQTRVCSGPTTVPSRAAIGAEARVLVPGRTPLVQQVDGGNGHSGKRSPDLQFGLGHVAAPVTVELRWRDARGVLQQETVQLAPGGWYTILLGRERGVNNECK
ncbi:MAG TPA: FG-GAP-like repeat-containing protein [Pyrinomonadaceae bacterium]|nr:FG-GAP-like repeat-containing protein [Pyrinomonadaceae bacterium]